MALKIRIFICTNHYGKNRFKGDVLEVYGELFKYFGYIRSPIKTYLQLHSEFDNWKEVRTQSDLTDEEKKSTYILNFLEHIPVI